MRNFNGSLEPLKNCVNLQEINMFKFGVMPDNKDVPQTIPDKYIRDAKGFDDMSFKKRK